MRILVISNLFPPDILGGYEILCEQVCSELRNMGHEIRVLTSVGQTADTVHYPVDRFLSLYLPFEKPAKYSRSRRWLTHRKNYSITQWAISQFEPDVIFIWSQLRLTVGCALAAEESGIPVAYTMNDEHLVGYFNCENSAMGSIRRLIDESFLQISARQLKLSNVTCISRTLKKRLCEMGLPLAKSKVIYQGIPIQNFPLKALPGSIGATARLLYAGQLHEYKGVHTLLEAAEILTKTGRSVAVTICGGGNTSYENSLREMAASGRTKVEFLGRVHHQEIPRIYRAHDIFVFPSIWCEPFGLTHLEAMASGTGVVSTAEGGHGEFLRNEINSLIFEPGSGKDLARKLAVLLDDAPLSRAIARTAFKQVTTEFSLNSYARRLASWLEDVKESLTGNRNEHRNPRMPGAEVPKNKLSLSI